jgi:hypothetical protein
MGRNRHIHDYRRKPGNEAGPSTSSGSPERTENHYDMAEGRETICPSGRGLHGGVPMTAQQWAEICDKITERSLRLNYEDEPIQELTAEEEAEYQSRASRVRCPLERLRSAAAELDAAAREAFWAAYEADYPKYDRYVQHEENHIGILVMEVVDVLEEVGATTQVAATILNNHRCGPLTRGAEPYYLGRIVGYVDKIKTEFSREFNFWFDCRRSGDGIDVMYRPKAKPTKPSREARFKGGKQ